METPHDVMWLYYILVWEYLIDRICVLIEINISVSVCHCHVVAYVFLQNLSWNEINFFICESRLFNSIYWLFIVGNKPWFEETHDAFVPFHFGARLHFVFCCLIHFLWFVVTTLVVLLTGILSIELKCQNKNKSHCLVG